jgi:hypothetical protein
MIAYHHYLTMVVPNAYWQKKYVADGSIQTISHRSLLYGDRLAEV